MIVAERNELHSRLQTVQTWRLMADDARLGQVKSRAHSVYPCFKIFVQWKSDSDFVHVSQSPSGPLTATSLFYLIFRSVTRSVLGDCDFSGIRSARVEPLRKKDHLLKSTDPPLLLKLYTTQRYPDLCCNASVEKERTRATYHAGSSTLIESRANAQLLPS